MQMMIKNMIGSLCPKNNYRFQVVSLVESRVCASVYGVCKLSYFLHSLSSGTKAKIQLTEHVSLQSCVYHTKRK